LAVVDGGQRKAGRKRGAANPSFDRELESPRLRQVHEHFASVRSPRRVVAASAIFRANKIINARMDSALATLDLTTARYELLGLLDNTEGGRLSLGALGRTTLYHPATMTYTIDGLEKRGLITRRPDPTDRRAVLAEITPAGRKLVRQATKVLEELDWGLEELSEEDASTVAVLLSNIHPA
jgi:DNA-binding MarR family transcriptional regulator